MEDILAQYHTAIIAGSFALLGGFITSLVSLIVAWINPTFRTLWVKKITILDRFSEQAQDLDVDWA